MTYNLLYKVGRNKMYKTYTQGEYSEVHQSFNDLNQRATNKNFKIVARSYGNMGVVLCYSNGKQNVSLLICSETEKNLWWIGKIEY